MSPDRRSCFEVADLLTSAVDGHPLTPEASVHVAECLRCQAEVAQYRRLARTMAGLAAAPAAPPPGLEHEVLVALDGLPPQFRRRVTAKGAAAFGGVAAAAGVIALAARGLTRQRRGARLAV